MIRLVNKDFQCLGFFNIDLKKAHQQVFNFFLSLEEVFSSGGRLKEVTVVLDCLPRVARYRRIVDFLLDVSRKIVGSLLMSPGVLKASNFLSGRSLLL